ncbi:ferric reduction oxidase 2-like [Pyrus ussuriensis x Pyrus communis]|uniref:ferric-chelate reductase (NADH) n=1 Tax=Pyrus ussuriensis x Pyrus communis TaxID=2448454 RepID=A0A5N5FH84_9ROSA|nr:ferric reduction oxidase 2-like [Pyrus ussuriensis x Pyrus communis]
MDAVQVVKSSSPPSHEGIHIARAAIRLLAIFVVFLGTLLIWLMMPTNTYRQIWLPQIRLKASSSTYLGAEGGTILVYTFPILFIAVLGCVYLHLGKKLNNHELKSSSSSSGTKKNRFAVWKQPMLVKGPLGIVSGIELAFFVIFVTLLVWSLSTYLHNKFKNITTQSAAKHHEQVWESKLDSAALVLGLVGNICLAFLFFPVARGSSVLALFGLTSEGSIKYHIWLGHIVLAFFTAHGLCYIIYWAATEQISQMVIWDKVGVSNVAGELALLCGLIMWATAIPRIRRKMFELFFYTHYLYILFMFFFILHVGIAYACIALPSFYLFLVDRYLRFLQSRTSTRLIFARVLPCETLELNLAKTPGLKYNPTSVMFINVPSISKMQWHPFTVTSNSSLEPEKISIVVKGEGSWSKKLYQMLSSPSPTDRIEVAVEGPYGPASTHFLRHDTLVMVSGGSGITPFVSIIRELLLLSTSFSCKVPKVVLICAFKNSLDLTMLDLTLPMSSTSIDLSNLNLQIEAYVTRETEPKTDGSKPVRSIWFKPNANDAPVSPILGTNHWLWLALIISSSFVVFLVLIGIITRYYIYPIDHNSNTIFSYSLRAVLNILVICVSIASTASGAVLWNKKKNAMENKQIQNMEGPSPMGTPQSLYYNADRELESLPQQSLAQATNVHYGERPDLKKVIFECKGSSIGVLASGPKKMRHEVATICSSGLAENLHFESISFSW